MSPETRRALGAFVASALRDVAAYLDEKLAEQRRIES